MSIFSNRLKATRLSQHLRQQDLADKAEIALRTYQSYEKGEREPLLLNLIALADALGVSLDYLAGRTDDPTVKHSSKGA